MDSNSCESTSGLPTQPAAQSYHRSASESGTLERLSYRADPLDCPSCSNLSYASRGDQMGLYGPRNIYSPPRAKGEREQQ